MYHSLNILLKLLIQHYIIAPHCLILIQSNQSATNFNIVPLRTIIINVDISSDISKISDVVFHNFGCQYFVLNVEAPSKLFEAIEAELRKHREMFTSRKYIISSINITEDDFEIFRTKSINFVSDVIVIRLDKLVATSAIVNNFDLELSIWTHKFSAMENYNEHFMLDKWFSANKSFLNGIRLFYNKLKNLQGRKLVVGTFDYRPFVIVDEVSSEFRGVDIHLVETIIQYLNGTMKIFHEKGLWGYAYPNGSSYGLMGKVKSGIVDIGAAGLYMTEMTWKQFEITHDYLMSEITLLVPAARLTAPWSSPYQSFSVHVWISLILAYSTLALAVYFLSYCKVHITNNTIITKIPSKFQLFLSTIAIVGKPLIKQSLNKKYHFKLLLSLILLAGVIISEYYYAGFSSVMTKPIYENSIETREQFFKSDIPWGTKHSADWIRNWEKHNTHKEFIKRIVIASPEQLREFSKEGNFAFMMGKVSGQLHVEPYIKEDVIEKYQVMKQHINTQYVVLLLRKQSVLKPVFNKIIYKLLQSGIIDFWTREVSGHEEYVINTKLVHLSANTNHKKVILKLSHVIGAFYILLNGIILALLVFFIEIVLNK